VITTKCYEAGTQPAEGCMSSARAIRAGMPELREGRIRWARARCVARCVE
jgi:hypothetical protein